MNINGIQEIPKLKNTFSGNIQGFDIYKKRLGNLFLIDEAELNALKECPLQEEIDDTAIEFNKNKDLAAAQKKLYTNLQSAKGDIHIAASLKNFFSDVYTTISNSDNAHAFGDLFFNPYYDNISYFGYFNDDNEGLRILKILREIHACEEEQLKKARTPREIYTSISAANVLALSRLNNAGPHKIPKELPDLAKIYLFRHAVLRDRYPGIEVIPNETERIIKKYNDFSIQRVKETVNTYIFCSRESKTH